MKAAAPLQAGECWRLRRHFFVFFVPGYGWGLRVTRPGGREKHPGNVFNYAQHRLTLAFFTKNKEAFFREGLLKLKKSFSELVNNYKWLYDMTDRGSVIMVSSIHLWQWGWKLCGTKRWHESRIFSKAGGGIGFKRNTFRIHNEAEREASWQWSRCWAPALPARHFPWPVSRCPPMSVATWGQSVPSFVIISNSMTGAGRQGQASY